MSYSVEHVRFTLECDACGLVEKRDMDKIDTLHSEGTQGWAAVQTPVNSYFCCPGCLEQVSAILERRRREKEAAQAALEAACEHDYQQTGFLRRCTKCKAFQR